MASRWIKVLLAMTTVLFLSAHSVNIDKLRELQKLELSILKECNEKLNVDEKQFEYLVDFAFDKLGNTKEIKCLTFCGLQGVNLMTPDAELSDAGAEVFSSLTYKDTNNREGALDVHRLCAADTGMIQDKCEKAYEYTTCFMRKTKEAAIPGLHNDQV